MSQGCRLETPDRNGGFTNSKAAERAFFSEAIALQQRARRTG
jgi:hypothetical protein